MDIEILPAVAKLGAVVTVALSGSSLIGLLLAKVKRIRGSKSGSSREEHIHTVELREPLTKAKEEALAARLANLKAE
jgi:hypothetical protein